jgi:peptidoglycan/xylan/chitin deacetylase (PgdA/CDA1 family)
MDAYSLMYHDVIRRNGLTTSGFAGPAADSYKLDAYMFERHLTEISDVVAQTDLERVTNARELSWRAPLSRPAVMLHFDDGGACALDVADRLERARWRGYFHITTDRIGTAGFVTASDLRELHARGHVIGSHSCSHPPRMSSLPWKVMLREWTASKATLEQVLGAPVTVASVPGGFCSHQVILAADEAGIEVLFTSEPTSRYEWIRGCLVLGRYAIRRTTPPEQAAGYATGALLPCWEQWAAWNAKKMLKRIGGEHWLTMRKHLFSWKPR